MITSSFGWPFMASSSSCSGGILSESMLRSDARMDSSPVGCPNFKLPSFTLMLEDPSRTLSLPSSASLLARFFSPESLGCLPSWGYLCSSGPW